jgi:hypothetical protein
MAFGLLSLMNNSNYSTINAHNEILSVRRNNNKQGILDKYAQVLQTTLQNLKNNHVELK